MLILLIHYISWLVHWFSFLSSQCHLERCIESWINYPQSKRKIVPKRLSKLTCKWIDEKRNQWVSQNVCRDKNCNEILGFGSSIEFNLSQPSFLFLFLSLLLLSRPFPFSSFLFSLLGIHGYTIKASQSTVMNRICAALYAATNKWNDQKSLNH